MYVSPPLHAISDLPVRRVEQGIKTQAKPVYDSSSDRVLNIGLATKIRSAASSNTEGSIVGS
jgi:hypothetical protein